MEKIKRKKSTSRGCYMCTERKVDYMGHNFCPHIKCPFEKKELEWWKDVGGKTLIEEK